MNHAPHLPFRPRTHRPPAPPLAQTQDGARRPALDVLIVGAGQGGLATGFALLRDKVANILLVERAPNGQEGPWVTYARTPPLRSANDQTGPDLNIPSLTYQAWHEAQWGAADWQAMKLIPSDKWNDYLLWFCRVVGLPMRNDVAVTAITPAPRMKTSPASPPHSPPAKPCTPARSCSPPARTAPDADGCPISSPPCRRRSAPTADAIDFPRLAGKTVSVLGAGASAFDNAAVALEHGAASVHLFCRRPEPTVVQPYRWLTFARFLHHLGDMPDEWRWRFMQYIQGLREGFPADTWARVAAFPNCTMNVGRPWTDARVIDGRVRLNTPKSPFDADFVICSKDIDHDASFRPELSAFADNIATWADRYTPPPDARNDRLARFPYLTQDYAFAEKIPGRTPWIADIYLFGIGTTMSFGPSDSSINAMTIAAPKLAAGITRGLFRTDLVEHWCDLQAYNVKQVEIDPVHLAHEVGEVGERSDAG